MGERGATPAGRRSGIAAQRCRPALHQPSSLRSAPLTCLGPLHSCPTSSFNTRRFRPSPSPKPAGMDAAPAGARVQ